MPDPSFHLQIIGAGSEIDFVANPIFDVSMRISLDAPSTFRFSAGCVDQHELAFAGIGHGTAIKFWDTNSGSTSAPLFIGIVDDVDPGESSRRLKFSAVDPTGAAKFDCFNADWTSETEPASTGYPRLVYNSRIDNDDDKIWELLPDATVGEIIASILDFNLKPLQRIHAAPSGSGVTAYDQADIDLLTIKPQEKVVIQQMNPRAAVMKVLGDYYPRHRLFFDPRHKKWRFRDLALATGVELVLNDITATNPVLSMSLTRSIQGRYSAISIYGPESAEDKDVSVSGGGLTNVSYNGVTPGTTPPILDTFGAGVAVYGQNSWQITDVDKRRILGLLIAPFAAPQVGQTFGSPTTGISVVSIVHTMTRSPTFMVRFPNDNMGTSDWVTVEGWFPDRKNGLIDFKTNFVGRYNPNPPVVSAITQPHWTNPIDARLVYSTPTDRLAVRYPETGYDGELFDVLGMEEELHIYDEMLAVQYENFQAVTTVERRAQFTEMARQIWEERSRIIYAGTLVQEGLDFGWVLNDKGLNLSAVDENQAPVTTGWEAINALITDVTWNYTEDTTEITIDSDHLEAFGVDPEQLRRDLGIRRLEAFNQVLSSGNVFHPQAVRTYFTNRILNVPRVEYRTEVLTGFRDPVTNQLTGKSVQTISNFSPPRDTSLQAYDLKGRAR